MRQTICLLALTALISCENWKSPLNPDPYKNIEISLDKFELKGEVSGVTIKKLNANGDLYQQEQLDFNEQGNLLSKKEGKGDEMELVNNYSYSPSGQILNVYEKKYKHTQKFVGVTTTAVMMPSHKFSYIDGLLESIEMFNADKRLGATNVQYDNQKGQYRTISDENSKGVVHRSKVYERNDDGNVTKIFTNQHLSNIYHYDGMTVTDTAYSVSDGKVVDIESYAFDGDNIIAITEYYFEKEDSTWKPEKIRKMEYDLHGSVVKYTQKRPRKSEEEYISTYLYKYDGEGNWIEKVTYKDGEPSEMEQREITYRKRRFLGILP